MKFFISESFPFCWDIFSSYYYHAFVFFPYVLNAHIGFLTHLFISSLSFLFLFALRKEFILKIGFAKKEERRTKRQQQQNCMFSVNALLFFLFCSCSFFPHFACYLLLLHTGVLITNIRILFYLIDFVIVSIVLCSFLFCFLVNVNKTDNFFLSF